MSSRQMIEFMSKGGAGVISQTEDYYWCHVLNLFDMYVHKNDKSITPHLVNDGYWESWITKWVMDNVKPGSNFIDIGANTGYYSFLAHQLGAWVLAFEPNPTYAKMMRDSISRRDTQTAIYVHCLALSNYNGEAVLNIPTELHGSASLTDIPGYETTKCKVEVTSLDDITYPSGKHSIPTIIKIDAEGEEERILEGARRVLDDAADVVVLLEYTPNAYSSDFLDELFDNWHVTTIDSNGDEQRIVPQWVEAQQDWVMLVLR